MLTSIPLSSSLLATAITPNLFLLVVLGIGFLLAAVMILLAFWALFHDAQAPSHAGEESVPLLWGALIAGIVLAIFLSSSFLYIKSISLPKHSEEILVVAKNWMWKFQHAPDGKAEIDTLHVAVGQPVQLIMTSQDSTHSLFVPAFKQQQDILPGRFTAMILQVDAAGEYPFYTTQYSGAGYTDMAGKIIAMEPADYEDWLHASVAQTPALPAPGEAGEGNLAAEGELIFTATGCSGCHGDVDAPVAPTLNNIAGTEITLADGSTTLVDEAYIRESIVNTGSKLVQGYADIMPKTYETDLTEAQIDALVAYIISLGTTPGASDIPAVDDTTSTPQATSTPEPTAAPQTPAATTPEASSGPGSTERSGDIAAGEALFTANGCNACHTETDTPVAPTLHGILGQDIELDDGSTITVDDAYLHESIADSQAKLVKGFGPLMPPSYGNFSDQDFLDLIAYIKTLSP